MDAVGVAPSQIVPREVALRNVAIAKFGDLNRATLRRVGGEAVATATLHRPIRARMVLLIVAWLVITCGSFVALWRYKSTPGKTSTVAVSWPPSSALERATDRPTLVMLAHPYCPCTRASMNQLAEIMTTPSVKAKAYVVFMAWDDVDPETTELWRRAAKIPFVTPVVDRDGVEAARFGAATSGHVLVYDVSGRQLFSGGITGARGHEGDNAGRQRIVSLLTTGSAERADSPIFGCSLED
jgi:hypothetical protein